MTLFPTDDIRLQNLNPFPGIGRGNGRNFLRYPLDNFNKNHGWINFTELTQELNNDGSLTLTTPRRGTTVSLYIPKEGLVVADKAEYENIDFGVLGTFTETAAREDINVLEGVEAGARAISDAAMVFAGQTKDVGLITKVLQRTRNIVPDSVSGAVRTRIGRTANPHIRAVFKQVGRRSFSYQFEMIPNNPKEARTIKNIIKFFRANLYPEVEGPYDYVYKFPNKFDIQYRFGDRKRIGHKLKYCYLTDVKATYNNQGSMTFYPDGEFISSRLELTFTEERTISRQDVLDETDGVGY